MVLSFWAGLYMKFTACLGPNQSRSQVKFVKCNCRTQIAIRDAQDTRELQAESGPYFHT